MPESLVQIYREFSKIEPTIVQHWAFRKYVGDVGEVSRLHVSDESPLKLMPS